MQHKFEITEAPHGFVFKPAGVGPYPAVVLLHVSLGGWGDYWNEKDAPNWLVGLQTRTAKFAEYLATNGIVTYHAPYFHAGEIHHLKNKIPDELVNVPLEITSNAIAWLREQEYTLDKVGIFGASRGAERALLVSTLNKGAEKPDVIVAASPAAQAVTGFATWQADSIRKGVEPDFLDSIHSWTFQQEIIKVGTAINFQELSQPMLYFYFTPDPIWEGHDKVQAIHKSLNSTEYQIEEDETPLIAMQDDLIGINFKFAGHSFADPTNKPKLNAFQKELILKFFKIKLSI